eukprot:973707-Pelagomonas_calceolata.AAC.1
MIRLYMVNARYVGSHAIRARNNCLARAGWFNLAGSFQLSCPPRQTAARLHAIPMPILYKVLQGFTN